MYIVTIKRKNLTKSVDISKFSREEKRKFIRFYTSHKEYKLETKRIPDA